MATPAGRQGILSLTIKDKSALYAAYMPFVKNGGLFIPSNKKYKLGDEVFMLLTLMEEKEKPASNYTSLNLRKFISGMTQQSINPIFLQTCLHMNLIN